RGMTTDLGFAFLGRDVTVIDVPGHERFVRHMLAGASTLDVVMLVVAADDGVMPQTREHFEICRLLGLRKGIIVLNKADLVEPDLLELVKEDVAAEVKGSFLEGAPMVAVSALTGQGIPELKEVIATTVAGLAPKPDRGVFRLPVDRCFSMKGFGTVIAGTVLSGRCRVGDRLELQPRGVEVRIRGIQQHNQPVESAGLGERAALNLQGIERETVVRGNVLATPGYFRSTEAINGSFYLLQSAGRPLRNMTRVHLHIGTAEVMCRVALLDVRELAPGREALVQLRLESPVVCDWGDHYVVRLFSPQQTIGGGMVLEANPDKERRFDQAPVARLRALMTGEAGSVLEQYLVKSRFEAKTLAQAAKDLALSQPDAQSMCELLLTQGKAQKLVIEAREYLIHARMLAEARKALLDTLEKFHRENPIRLGMKRPELRAKAGAGMSVPVFEAVMAGLVQEGAVVVETDRVRLAGHQVKLNQQEQKEFDRLDAAFREAGLAAPSFEEALAGVEKRLADRVKVALLESGRLVDCGEGVALHRDAVTDAERKIREMFGRKPELTASEIRQELGTTRKYVIPLLNHFDTTGLTQRRGEVRVLRQKPAVPGN
ncbi:selenocysteine-specific translation elongation factor, partial [candidate division WOR-3 bacterium]|nr:selenocysteine-specific translation elongation factor [candidate division WOR-3 bacterium]